MSGPGRYEPPPDIEEVDRGWPPHDLDSWDTRRMGERRRPTTAEQAVPWLVALVLALSGIVIVLLVLIFTTNTGQPGGVARSPSAPPLSGLALGSGAIPRTPAPTPTPPAGTPVPSPPPKFGPLDMVFLARTSAVGPIWLFHHDFSTTATPQPYAQADQGVASYAWAPDGSGGVALIGAGLVSVRAGKPSTPLADGVQTATFSLDSATVYAVRTTRAGASDRTEVLAINFINGRSRSVATVTYAHPVVVPQSPVQEAQFADDGGLVRLYATTDGNLVLWLLGAPAYRIDPNSGATTVVQRAPVLWSPDVKRTVALRENAGQTTLTLTGSNGVAAAQAVVTGFVSHLRWSPSGAQVVFTLGIATPGGVRQDLYLWDLTTKAPEAITSSGATFGAEWLGTAQSWQP